MFDFISRNYKLVIAIAIAIIVILIGILLFSNKGENVVPTNTTGINELDYGFLKDNISKEDKYLMLLAKISVEDYGTFSTNDTRSLQNLKNQSSTEFAIVVQDMIDSLPVGQDVITTVDVDSIKIIDSVNHSVSMTAVHKDNLSEKETTNEYIISFVNENGYWLVKEIVKK